MLIPFLIFLACLLGSALYAGPVFVRLGRQLGQTGAAVEAVVRRMDERFLPQAEQLVGKTSSAVRELEAVGAEFQRLGLRAEEAISPLGDITVAVEVALRPLAETAGAVGLTGRRVRAWSVGARAIWGAWSRLRALR
jgi:hypothetical protein